MAHKYEHFYGDTSALCLPTRSYAFEKILNDPVVRDKLVHGSDWPIIALPPVMELGVRGSLTMMREPNWMRRDVLIKKKLGLDEQYWHRAGRILRGGDVSPRHTQKRATGWTSSGSEGSGAS
jgi:hypothetical protein